MKRAHPLLVAVAVLITGCSDPSPQALFDDYLHRLGNVTGVEAQSGFEPIPLLEYPPARELVLAGEELRIGFSDYFRIAQCDLRQAVSERNSSLGLFQRPSGRLLYEMDFFAKIRRCDEALDDVPRRGDAAREAFKDTVSRIRASKAATLPLAFWNATFGSPEMRVLFSTGAAPFDTNEPIDAAGVETALSYLSWLGRHLQDGAPAITPAELETHYFHLQAEKTIGRLLRSLQVSHVNLAIATDLLARAARANALCPMGKRTRRGEFLHNVFVKYYAGGVQPYLGRIHRASDRLLGAVGKLFEVQSAPVPEAFARYYVAMADREASGGLWRRFNAQLSRHTRAWQTVLRQCDLMPAAPKSP